jgi:hypothetical protein
MLPCHYHAVTPCDWFTIGHTFDDAECLIAQKVVMYTLLPVEGYCGWSVACSRFGIWVHMDLDWWALHAGKCTMLRKVEGG